MNNLNKIICSLEKPKTFTQLKEDTCLENGVLQHHINNSSRIQKEKDAIMLHNQCGNCELKEVCSEKCIHTTLQDFRKNRVTALLNKGLLQSEIADKLDLSRPTVNYHIKTLRKANILDKNTVREPIKEIL
jgi:radical SAM protein with 4Fe4S-binding SPASM domain